MPQDIHKGTAYMVGGFGLGMIAHFCAQVVAGRALGPEMYGLYGLVIYNAAMVSGLFDSGLSVAMTTHTAAPAGKSRGDGVRRTIRAGVTVELMIVTVFLVLCLVFHQSMAKVFFRSSTALLLFFAGIVIAQGICGLLDGVLSGLRELKIKAIVRFMQQAFLLMAIMILVQGLSLGVNAALASYLFSICLALFIIYWFVRGTLKGATGRPSLTGGLFDRESIATVLKTAIPVSVAFVAYSCIRFSGPLVLTLLASGSDATLLGVFVVLLTLGRVVDSFFMVIVRSLFPYLIKWHAEGSQQQSGKYLAVTILLILAVYGCLALISLQVGNEIIVFIFGSRYASAACYLPAVFIVFSSFSVCTVSKIALYAIKRPGVFLAINIVGLFVFCLIFLAGHSVLTAENHIYLILLAMGAANLIIIGMAFGVYKMSVKKGQVAEFSEAALS